MPVRVLGENSMTDFLIGLAFVAMIMAPVIVATIERAHDEQDQ